MISIEIPSQRCRYGLVVVVLSTLSVLGTLTPAASAIPANVNISRTPNFETEPTIAVDPAQPNRLFAASNTNSNALFAAVSTDGGATWSSSDPTDGVIADGSDGLPVACCDPNAVFDAFGNLFLTYLTASFDVVVVSSTNGGKSFTVRSKIRVGTSCASCADPTSSFPTRHPSGRGKAAFRVSGDQPSLAVGPGVVWVTYQDESFRIAGGGARVTGLGAIGAFHTPQVAPGSLGANFGDIAIGPSGQVLVTYQNPSDGEGPATISVNLDADGLGGSGFSPRVAVTKTNVGGFDYIPAQPNRSVDAECNLAWDRSSGTHRGRVYLGYTNEMPDESNDLDIFVRFSDDNGVTWSAPVRVNDDTGSKSQFFPHIALDQTSGVLALSWYDCRNDRGTGATGSDTDGVPNTDTQFFATFSTDGGASFRPNIRASAGTSNAVGRSASNEYGDYSGLAFHAGFFYPCWVDNSNSTRDNPSGKLRNLDVYTARVAASPPVLQFQSAILSGGNGDQSLDPDECNNLFITLHNDGSDATNVAATLTTSTPGITIIADSSRYPNMAGSATAVNHSPFQISTSSDFQCGRRIQLTLTVTVAGDYKFVLPLELSSGALGTVIHFDNHTPMDIPDQGTMQSPIKVAGTTSPIGQVKVSLFITHRYDADLAISLIAPDGTTVLLSSNNGGSGDDYGTACNPGLNRTTFSDNAATSITAGAAPFSGTFRPEGHLAKLIGKSGAAVNGTWKLRVTDAANLDAGVLNCWSLFIAPTICQDGGGACASTTTAHVRSTTQPPSRKDERSEKEILMASRPRG